MLCRKALFVILTAFLFGIIVSRSAACQEPEDDQEFEVSTSKRGDQVLFHDVIPRIKSKTRVPIFVPAELPAPNKYSEAQLMVGDGEADKYGISLYYARSRANVNFMGSFAGEKIQRKPRFGAAFFERVVLANGITGHFHDVSCGGSCAPPMIVWVKDGFKYTLQLSTRSKSKGAMIKAANSAILAGAR
jgi:hypothetical protein